MEHPMSSPTPSIYPSRAPLYFALTVILTVLTVPLICAEELPKPTPARPHQEGWKKLSPEEERVIIDKGTERPYTGEFFDHHEEGTYVCKRCGVPLFVSSTKFDSGCGWPSFDEPIPGAVTEVPDPDGSRTEILCTNCGGHLGHVFRGEGFTPKSTRHCVNSISMEFQPASAPAPEPAAPPPAEEVAYFAGGCFWGVEYLLEQAPGVLNAESGYMGGHAKNPTYEEVCDHTTGHIETVKVVFDPSKTTYKALAMLFFEIHDPTQVDRQGPDVGEQYRSVVFYEGDDQRAVAQALIDQLRTKGLAVATQLQPAGPFWTAEGYHQDYYKHKGTTPYCHARTERF
jgi:peptide methionine sulfoxide reductase msrA/msrB